MALRPLGRLDEPLSPVWIVTGDAEPLVSAAERQLVEAASTRVAMPTLNHSVHRASEPHASEALSTARTLPMMSPTRLVVVRELHLGTDEFFVALVGYLARPSDSTVLVVTGEKFPKVEKGGTDWAARVRKLLPAERWIKLAAASVRPDGFARDHARELGKVLGKSEAALLVEIAGSDLGRLAREVEKVALYVGEAEVIEAAAIHRACSLLAEAEIWDLTAAIAVRDADGGLAALHRLQEAGDDPRRLLGMIAWQLRALCQMAELARRGAPDAAVRDVARMRAEIYHKVKPRLTSGFPSTAEVLEKLARTNRHLNSHRAGDARMLEALVLDLVRPAAAPPPRETDRSSTGDSARGSRIGAGEAPAAEGRET